MERWGFMLLVATIAGTVYFLPDCFVDRYFTSGQLWVCGIAGAWGIFALWRAKRCSYLGMAVGSILLVAWGYGFVSGYLGWQALGWCVALWLLLLVAENWEGGFSYRKAYFVLALSLGVEAIVGIGQFAGLWQGNGQFRVTGTFENPAGLAAYSAICFPFALFFLPERGKWLFGGGVALLAVAAVALSGSRSGIAALVAVGTLYIWGRHAVKGKIRRWWVLAFLGTIVLGGVLLYNWKKDSADGRLLVWRCTAEMMADAPFAGHAPGSFQAEYMGYQAAFLERHPEGRWVWLADNVKHPFNEYLKLGAECGLAGLAVLAVGLWWLWRGWRRNSRERAPLFLGIAGIAVCGLFSYPLNYPGVAALFFLLLGLIGREEKQIHWQGRRWCFPFISISLALVVFTGYWAKQEALWGQLSRMSLQGNFAEAEQGYRVLYPFLRENPLFLYNYGAELHYAGCWSESLAIMEECAEGLDDVDVRLLLGDACERIGDDAGAERHFRQAASMCPVRFVPPYRLVKLYERTGRHEEAVCLAAELAEKPVKVPSYMVAKIKREMRDFIRCEQNE